MKQQYIKILSNYLPNGAEEYVAELIIKHQTHFKISRPRKTKLGDYRSPKNGKGHRISVNANLNPYSFLITTLHEFAHLTTYKRFKHEVYPHGPQWKTEFLNLFNPVYDLIDFPQDIKEALFNYFKNPKASSCSDDKLMRVLKRYDKNNDELLVEHIKTGQKFKLNGKTFVKGKRLRKYYLCTDVNTKKEYRVNGLAEIQTID